MSVTKYPSNKPGVETRGGSRSLRRVFAPALGNARAVGAGGEPDYSRPPKYDGGPTPPYTPERERELREFIEREKKRIVPSRDAGRSLSRALARAGRLAGHVARFPWQEILLPDAIGDGGGEPTNRTPWNAVTVPGGASGDPENPDDYDWTGWTWTPRSSTIPNRTAPEGEYKLVNNVRGSYRFALNGSSSAGSVATGLSFSELSLDDAADAPRRFLDGDETYPSFPTPDPMTAPVPYRRLDQGFAARPEAGRVLFLTSVENMYRSSDNKWMDYFGDAVGYYTRDAGTVGVPTVGGGEGETHRYAPLPWNFPEPEPARRGTPATQPSEWPAPWHNPDAVNSVDLPLMPFPVFAFPWPQTETDVVPQPATQTVVVSDSGVVGGELRPGRPTNRPPSGRGAKERKVRMAGRALVAWHVVNVVTEGADFVDALHDALPKRYRTRSRSPYDKAKAVYDHFDEVDVAKAVENYVNNQFSDWVWGNLGRAGAHLNQLTGQPTGGGRSLSWADEVGVSSETDERLVPEFHFDPVTGAWSIDTPFGSIGGNAGERVF